MNKKQIICEISFQCAANVNKSLRDHIGSTLRKLAAFIDGRYSLGIRINASPKISAKKEIECIRVGFDAMGKAIYQAVEEEAIEHVLRFSKPELYEDVR